MIYDDVPYIDEIRKHGQRYARIEKHPNILMKNLMKSIKTPRKRKTSTRLKRLIHAIL
jgi:hypothetical protein